jgi:hypothetical protein
MSKICLRRNLNVYEDLKDNCKRFKRRDVVRVLSSRVKRLSNMENQLIHNMEVIENRYEESDEEIKTGDQIKLNQASKLFDRVHDTKERLDEANQRIISQTKKERVIKKPLKQKNQNRKLQKDIKGALGRL